jgi:hypothetical protein
MIVRVLGENKKGKETTTRRRRVGTIQLGMEHMSMRDANSQMRNLKL